MSKSRSIQGEWGSALTLSNEDAFHFMVAHGAKHHWCRMKWLLDLVWFIGAVSPETLQASFAAANENGFRRATSIGIGLALPFLSEGSAEIAKKFGPGNGVESALTRSYGYEIFLERGGIGAKAINMARVIIGSDSAYNGFKYALKRSLDKFYSLKMRNFSKISKP